MGVLDPLMPALMSLLDKGRFPEERRIAVCVLDDVIEFSPAGCAKYMGQASPRATPLS